MKDEVCGEIERKALDGFLDRIVSCRGSVSSRAMLIREINDRLDGPEPNKGCEEKKSESETCIFNSFSICLSEFEDIVRLLEVETDRLNRLI